MNSRRVEWSKIYHLALNMLPHYLAKLEWMNNYSLILARIINTSDDNYPAPGRGTGIIIEWFLSLFVSLSARLRENGWTDLHEIFREGVEWPWDDLIKFWVNSGKRVCGSKVNLFVIWFDCGLLAVLCCHLATENVMKLLFLAFHYVAARGRGLLCPAPQLVSFWNDKLSGISLWWIYLSLIVFSWLPTTSLDIMSAQ